MPRTTNNLTACPECDLLQRTPAVPPGGLAECARCGARLFRERDASLDRTLAYAIAAAVLFLLANTFVLMGLDARGIRRDAHLWETAWRLHEHGMTSVAILVFMTVIVVPVMQLGSLLYMLVPLKLGIHPRYLHQAYRVLHHAQPWAMVEVFVLGSIVSLVKLTQVATVEPHELWERAEQLGMALPAAEAEARA